MPRTTLSILQDRRQYDVSNKISLLEIDSAPFLAFSRKINKKRCIDPEFRWFEDKLGSREDAVNQTNESTPATSVVVDDSTKFKAGYLVKVPRTGEVMLVTEVTEATHTLTVTRGFGETSAVNLVDDDPLLIIGNANAEGADAPDENDVDATKVFNYTQIFRTVFGVTETENATETLTGKDMEYLIRKKKIEHAIDIERALLFGERKELAAGPKRTTRGLLKFLTSNVTDISDGSMSEWEFEAFCESAFAFGSTSKIMFASPRVVSVINMFGRNKLQTATRDEAYGLAATKYISAHGELLIVKEPLFKGAVYGGYGVVVDPEEVSYRFLRDTKLKTNIQDNDTDAIKHEYITECGLEVRHPDKHGLLKGVTAAA
jgi:hypothetical protein